MSRIDIYTTGFCPFCYRARSLLDAKGATYREIDVMVSPGARDEMIRRSGGQRTVPQLFVGDHHVGGYDEMAALESAGRLDSLLQGE